MAEQATVNPTGTTAGTATGTATSAATGTTTGAAYNKPSFFRLPSRNWTIFWTVTASIAGLAAYDKWQLHCVRQSLANRANSIAILPMEPHVLPRKVIVYIEPTHWARYWFKEYIKPVFDAAALDYDLVEPPHVATIRDRARQVIWKAREMHNDQLLTAQQKRSADEKRRTLFGWIKSYFYVASEIDPLLSLPPGLRLPKYDPSIGLVAVGPMVWRNVLLGITEGNRTVPIDIQVPVDVPASSIEEAKTKDLSDPKQPDSDPSTVEFAAATADATMVQQDTVNASETALNSHTPEVVKLDSPIIKTVLKTIPSTPSDSYALDSSIAFPPLGFITGKNQSGWTGFPYRIIGFFNQRTLASQIGEQALQVAFEHTRPFVAGQDELCGVEDLKALPALVEDKAGVSEEDRILDSQCREALLFDSMDAGLANRLSVYN
ncbi:hypothetical protein BASA61_005888 [Batrachochytrium salamandrivorans]|nr:hypothetical protein BASA62_004998 [Batrachochytrium salamandrivorans]KAH6588528.1 hypothetical protein BASA61_005888 [Batrachochytrium salamandrivorans]